MRNLNLKRGVNGTQQDSSKESLKDRCLMNPLIHFQILYLILFESPYIDMRYRSMGNLNIGMTVMGC